MILFWSVFGAMQAHISFNYCVSNLFSSCEGAGESLPLALSLILLMYLTGYTCSFSTRKYQNSNNHGAN